MAAPDIVGVQNIYGKTNVLVVTDVATAIVTNNTASGEVYKVNHLTVCNVDGTNNADITVDLYRSNTAYHIAKTIVVPADATVIVINKDNPYYLEEGDALRCTASANSDLEATSSYEVIS